MNDKLTAAERLELETMPPPGELPRLPLHADVAERLAHRGLAIAFKKPFLSVPVYVQSLKAEKYLARHGRG